MGREAVLAKMPYVGDKARPAFQGAISAKPKVYVVALLVIVAIGVLLWFAGQGRWDVLLGGATAALAFSGLTAHAAAFGYVRWVDDLIAKGNALPPVAPSAPKPKVMSEQAKRDVEEFILPANEAVIGMRIDLEESTDPQDIYRSDMWRSWSTGPARPAVLTARAC